MGDAVGGWLWDNHTAVVFHTSKKHLGLFHLQKTPVLRNLSEILLGFDSDLGSVHLCAWNGNKSFHPSPLQAGRGTLTSSQSWMKGICLRMENKTLEIMETTLWLWSPSHGWLLKLRKSTATMDVSPWRSGRMISPQENGAPPAPCWPGGWQSSRGTSWPQGQGFLSTPRAAPALQGLPWAPAACFSAGSQLSTLSDDGLNERNAGIADYSSSHNFRQ